MFVDTVGHLLQLEKSTECLSVGDTYFRTLFSIRPSTKLEYPCEKGCFCVMDAHVCVCSPIARFCAGAFYGTIYIDGLVKSRISHRALREHRDKLLTLLYISLRAFRLCAKFCFFTNASSLSIANPPGDFLADYNEAHP